MTNTALEEEQQRITNTRSGSGSGHHLANETDNGVYYNQWFRDIQEMLESCTLNDEGLTTSDVPLHCTHRVIHRDFYINSPRIESSGQIGAL